VLRSRRRRRMRPVGVTVAAVLVIGTRERMHGFVHLIPQDEVLTAGKFLILVGVVLRLAPDTWLIAISPVTPVTSGLRWLRSRASPISRTSCSATVQ